MVVFGCFQIFQNRKVRHFEERQDGRDEKRHGEEIDAKVTAFMLAHNDDLVLLPLCCIASIYGKTRYYNRLLYRDFCCQTSEVQNAILKNADLDLFMFDEPNLFDKCIQCVDVLQRNKCKNLFDIFYDNGKYVEKSITQYGSKLIPVHTVNYDKFRVASCLMSNNESLYSECLADVLLSLRNDVSSVDVDNILTILDSVYHFHKSSEIEACQYVCCVACFVSLYYKNENKSNCDRNLGYICDFDVSKLTMEDLFLITLFEIWFNLLD